MARSRIPNPLDRRHLIERELSPAQARAIAEAYLAVDRRVEAVDFLRKCGDPERAERLAELRAQAVAEGDVFLLRAVASAQGEKPDTAEWSAVARAADAAGKEHYAVEARRQADRGDN